jgi:hypothetical protein
MDVRGNMSGYRIVPLTMCPAALQTRHTPWKDEGHIEHLDKTGCDRSARARDPVLEQRNEYQAYGIIAE